MNIGLDIDGVIYPWNTSIYRHFIEQNKFEGTQKQFWVWFITLPEEIQQYYVRIPIFYLDTTPTSDVLTYLPLISEIFTIYYITARPDEAKWATMKFFDIYKLPFKENIIFSSDKANYVRLNRIEYFLDDSGKYVDEVKNITNAYLFKAVHNEEYRDQYNTVNSMKEFYEILRSKYDTKMD